MPLKSNNNDIENELQSSYVANEYGEVFKELGTAKKQLSSNELIEVNAKIYKKNINLLSQKSFKEFNGDKLYRYSIVCISRSKYGGKLTSTWLFGLWVKVNDVPITQPLYPDGKDVMIYTKPTVIHYIETEEENPLIKIGWQKTIPEPKIIK